MIETGTPKREKLLSVRDLRIGEKLPWPVYDRNGLLLLPQGTLITNQQQVDRLLSNHGHCYISLPQSFTKPRKTKRKVKVTTFNIVYTLLDRLEEAFRLLHDEQDTSFTRKIMQLVCDIQAVCDENSDAIIGTMHLIYDAPHGLVHPLHASILCEVAARQIGKTSLERFPIVAAALTHDIGMYEIQQELFEQSTPLTPQQQRIIKAHPKRGCKLLRHKGITDPAWLDPVMHHHERLDGSGYPDGLKGDKLTADTKLLAIADCYSAMIRPRVYRTRILPKDALKEIFDLRGSTIDENLARSFVSAIGIFSVGSLVEFESGAIGIVTRQTESISAPMVTLLTDTSGRPLRGSEMTTSDTSGEKIIGMVCLLEYRHLMDHLMDHLNTIWPRMSPISSES